MKVLANASPRARLRIYERYAAAADRGAWSVERDVDWGAIDPGVAHATPEVLDALRAAALIESFHPVNLGRFMRATWDDLDAGVAFSLEAYEGFKHFHALRRYLETVGHQPAITDEELVEARRAGAARQGQAGELMGRLGGGVASCDPSPASATGTSGTTSWP